MLWGLSAQRGTAFFILATREYYGPCMVWGGMQALREAGLLFLFWFAPLPRFLFGEQEFTLSYLKRTLESGTNTLISLKKLKVGAKEILRSQSRDCSGLPERIIKFRTGSPKSVEVPSKYAAMNRGHNND